MGLDAASWPQGQNCVALTIQFTGIDSASGSCLFLEIEINSVQACLFPVIRTQHCC